MEARDNSAKGLFLSKYGSEEERKSAMEEKLTALSSPAVVVCLATSEIHSLNYAEFQATSNAPFAYPTGTASFWKSLHATPADDLLCSAHPLHTSAFWSEAVQFDGITYNTELEPLGLKHEDWTRDVVEPMRRIYRESFEARQKFARELRSSPASSWTIKLVAIPNRYVYLYTFYACGGGAKDRDATLNCVVNLFLLPFRLVLGVVSFPPIFIMFLVFVLAATILDLLSCYDFRFGSAEKFDAIADVIKRNPDLDAEKQRERLQVEIQHLAASLSTKYPKLKFEPYLWPYWVEGNYYKTYRPASNVYSHYLLVSARLSGGV